MANRVSTYTQASTSTDQERPKSSDGAKKDMWSSMLDGVANGKRLPEKNVLVLGELVVDYGNHKDCMLILA